MNNTDSNIVFLVLLVPAVLVFYQKKDMKLTLIIAAIAGGVSGYLEDSSKGVVADDVLLVHALLLAFGYVIITVFIIGILARLNVPGFEKKE